MSINIKDLFSSFFLEVLEVKFDLLAFFNNQNTSSLNENF